MARLSWSDALFSAKTFAAAILALYIAFAADLPQPSWAMLTVLVVSQPIAGMVVAKSLFRVVGTVVGAGMALVFVAAFAQAGELFILALALWIGLCTGLAVLMRDAPGAYGVMLSGYSAAIVGIPAALAPETAFDTAIARCLEITLGITCATLVSQVVFPQTAGESLQRTIDRTLDAALRWAGDTLRGRTEADQGLADRRALIADVIALDSLRVYSEFDTPRARAASDVARHLQGQLLRLLSILVSVHDRVVLLRRLGLPAQQALQPLMTRVTEALERAVAEPASSGTEEAEALRAEIDARLPSFEAMVERHERILERNILLRLRDVIAVWRRILLLRDHLFAGEPLDLDEPAPSHVRYRDVSLAAVAALTSTAAVLTAAAFWFATGWPNGSAAVTFAGVICSIMAALDEPAAAARGFMRMTVLSAGIAAVYLFGILPSLDDFPSLVMALLPFFLGFGMLLTIPGFGTRVTPLGLNTVAFLGLTNTNGAADFAAFWNSTAGLVVGIGVGILMFGLLRPLGVDWAVQRIRRGILRDLKEMARPGSVVSRPRFQSRMFDRINALFTRLSPDRPDQLETMQACLAALRIGFNLLELKEARQSLRPEAVQAVDAALAALKDHFRQLARGRAVATQLPALDHAVAAVLAGGPAPGAERALVSLVALASALHRHGGFFVVERESLLPEVLRTAPA